MQSEQVSNKNHLLSYNNCKSGIQLTGSTATNTIAQKPVLVPFFDVQIPIFDFQDVC